MEHRPSKIHFALPLLCSFLTASALYLWVFQATESHPEAVVENAFPESRGTSEVEHAPDESEASGLQQQINSTQNSLDVLNQGLSEARLRNQPDFEQLKQLAIEELDRNRRKTESGGSQSPNILEIMDRTISDQVSSSANLKQYMLDHLDLDPAVRDTILKELIDQALELNSLNMQMMRRELTGQEYMAQRAKLSEDSVLSRHLSPEQQKEYRELETRQKEAVKVAAMMTRVASRSGPMSEASMDLLTQGLTAMDESQATQPDRSPLASPEKYLQDLQALESWFLGRIPEADVPGASVFFESERMSRKQARAITQQ